MTTQSTFSMTQHGRSEPFDLQVARGQIPYHSMVNIFGYQANLTTTQVAVWENNTAYVFPTVAQQMNLSSTNNADTATIQINGLDSSFNTLTEQLVLTGNTVVTTVNSYYRVNSINVTAGSTTNPAGTVTLKNTAGNVTYAQINAGVGKSQMAIYTVPANVTFYLSRIDASTSLNGNNAAYINYRNYNISPTGVLTSTAQAAFTQNYRIQRVMPIPYISGTDIQFQCGTSTGNAVVGFFVEGWLITNLCTPVGY